MMMLNQHKSSHHNHRFCLLRFHIRHFIHLFLCSCLHAVTSKHIIFPFHLYLLNAIVFSFFFPLGFHWNCCCCCFEMPTIPNQTIFENSNFIFLINIIIIVTPYASMVCSTIHEFHVYNIEHRVCKIHILVLWFC